jgi:hypothetical protein
VFIHISVHPCFCGGFADHTDSEAIVIRPGYLDSYWTKQSWTDQGIRDKVGACTAAWLPGCPTTAVGNTEYVYTISNSAASRVQTKTLGPNGNQISSYEIYDGLERLRPAQKVLFERAGRMTDLAVAGGEGSRTWRTTPAVQGQEELRRDHQSNVRSGARSRQGPRLCIVGSL